MSVAELKIQYKESLAEYGETMRQMVNAVKTLDGNRQALQLEKSAKNENLVRDQEHTVEELELKVELKSAELEDVRTRLLTFEEQQETAAEGKAEKLLKDKEAPVLRSILLDLVDSLAESQVSKSHHPLIES